MFSGPNFSGTNALRHTPSMHQGGEGREKERQGGRERKRDRLIFYCHHTHYGEVSDSDVSVLIEKGDTQSL